MADEIEAGNLRVLVIAGGSPLTAFPDPERMAAALARLDALAVIDVVASPLTDLATHLYPPAPLERTCVQAWNGRTGLAPMVVAPAAERRSTWKLFAALGGRASVSTSSTVSTSTPRPMTTSSARSSRRSRRRRRAVAASTHGVARPSCTAGSAIPPGRTLAHRRTLDVGGLPGLLGEAPAERPLRLLCTRITATKNSNDYLPPERLAQRPAVSMHPDDAAMLGISADDIVEVRSDAGHLRCVARLDAASGRGAVSIVHGSNSTNVTRLTSSSIGVDSLTGEPVMTVVPVSVRLVVDDLSLADA